MSKASVTGAVALIADDDDYFRMAVDAILRRELGFAEVVETRSFDEAVERLEGLERVDLALFDLNMPGIDGPAALRIIRDTLPVKKLAVVSASRRRGDILESLDAGAHGFISKGDGPLELRDALTKIMAGTVYVPRMLADVDGAAQPQPRETPARGDAAGAPRLTPRQWDVLEMLVGGKSNKQIARELDLGEGTVKIHLAALFRNLGVANRSAAAVSGARLLERRDAPPRPPRAHPLDGRHG